MNLDNERKAFEEKFKTPAHRISYDNLGNKYYCKYNLTDDAAIKYQARWEAWQASADREGYKLVPLQPSNETIVSIERKVENQLEASGIDADPFRLDGENIYKAMIGACDEN